MGKALALASLAFGEVEEIVLANGQDAFTDLEVPAGVDKITLGVDSQGGAFHVVVMGNTQDGQVYVLGAARLPKAA